MAGTTTPWTPSSISPAGLDDLDDALSRDPAACMGACGDADTGRSQTFRASAAYGQRQPLLVISPFAKENYVDHSITDQSSILRFIEDNWELGPHRWRDSNDFKAGTLNGMFDFDDKNEDGSWSQHKDEQHRRTLFLNPNTGEIAHFDGH